MRAGCNADKQEELRQQYMKDFILLYMLRRLEQQMQEQLKETNDDDD